MASFTVQENGRRKYDPKFKADIVQLVNTGTRVKELAEHHDVPAAMIYAWCSLHRRSSETQSAEGQLIAADQAEIKRLKRLLERSERREEILKKALSIVNPINS